MSIRNDITQNIVDILGDANDPKPLFVTRESIDIENLSRQQFPAIMVRSGNEVRNEFTMAGADGQRSSIYNIICQCFCTGANIDLQLNDIVERVEEALEADRTRGGVAYDTRLREIVVNDDIDQRFGEVSLNFEIEYQYVRGVA
jgi:regulator of RNase E activity RraB